MKYALLLTTLALLACDGGTPTEPPPPSGTTSAFAVALSLSCSRGQDSAAYCWGASVAGVVPMVSPVGADLHFASVFGGGGRHICALTAASAAYCWGDGQLGQLGNARVNIIALQPVPVAGGLKWRDLALGGSFTCGLTTTSELYCWGSHNFGATCTGATTDCVSPRAIPTPVKFRALSAATGFVCALGTDAAIYCWGTGVGVGNINGPHSPVPGNHRFTSVSTGFEHTCGIAEDNAAYCWGSNEYGQLGVPREALPVCTSLQPCTETPIKVTGGLAFALVSAGFRHTCGITTAGTAYCWGANYAGELGIGADDPKISYQPAPVASAEKFSAIAASQSGHTCALTVARILYCWGNNLSGEVGADSAQKVYNTPTRVAARLLQP